MSDRHLRRLTTAALAWWIAAGVCLGYGTRVLTEQLAAPAIATPAPYPVGQPGATPIAWRTPTSSVPSAVPVGTHDRGPAWVNCASRLLQTPSIVCEPRDADDGY